MNTMTAGSELAWRVASVEAHDVRSDTIGPDLLMVGLLSLEKLLDPSSPVSADERAQVRSEQRALAAVLADCALDASTFRRAIRRRIPAGAAASVTVRHRDAASRAAFERADALAAEHGDEPTGSLHLLLAILEAPTPVLEYLIAICWNEEYVGNIVSEVLSDDLHHTHVLGVQFQIECHDIDERLLRNFAFNRQEGRKQIENSPPLLCLNEPRQLFDGYSI